MPYVVTSKEPKGDEITLEQLLTGEVDLQKPRKKRNYPGTVTKYYASLPASLYPESEIRRLTNVLEQFAAHVWHYPVDMSGYYSHFQIPKRSGNGFRDISEPCSQLSEDQVKLRTLLQTEFHAAYHTSAFAYCQGRNTLYCVKRHQANQSKWFLKIDFSNFFGSTTMEFALGQLAKIAPFHQIMKTSKGLESMIKALHICFLNNGLPQGTPVSPMLTNLIMIPIDYELSNYLHKMGFVYTRFADDIQISHQKYFSKQFVITTIQEVLKKNAAPYRINPDKTRFGSSCGRNWNLGLMLNKNNSITIGHRQHKIFKAKLHSFIMDEINGKPWNHQEIEKLNGLLSYVYSIEAQTANHIVTHLEKKYKFQILKTIRNKLKQEQTEIRPVQFCW